MRETDSARNIISELRAGFERCEAILDSAQDSPCGKDLARLYYRYISTLRRKRFLKELSGFLTAYLHTSVTVICSTGSNTGSGRRIHLFSAQAPRCRNGEQLIINIEGLDSGALIPLISVASKRSTLEGVISATSRIEEIGQGPELDFLCVAAPLISQCFRNIKTFAALQDSYEDERRGRLAGLSREHCSIPGEFIGKLLAIVNTRERVMSRSEKRGRDEMPDGKRRGHSVLRRIFKYVFVLVMLFAISGLGSYRQVPVLKEPFNITIALAGDWMMGAPKDATRRALDDGLLRVWIASASAQEVHDWLKGDNPSGVDYEKILKEHGWSDRRVHTIGRIIGMVPY